MGSGGSDDRTALTSAKAQLLDLRAEHLAETEELEEAKSEVESSNDELADQLDEMESELASVQEKLDFIQSKRPAPDLLGQTPSAIANLASKFHWNVSVVKQISTATPGTIISQVPESGSTVQSGSNIKIVVAKAAPAPKPQPAAQAPAADSASGSGCDPNYSGTCVPQVSYDLNCDDISGSVTVLGSDPHGFDGDGDGYGCE